MIDPLFAMTPWDPVPPFIGTCLIAFVIADCFVRATASRKGERSRRAKLAVLAVLGGPTVGALLAGMVHAFGHVHPLDVGHTYSSFIGVGVFAGLAAGLVFATTALLSSNGPEKSPRNPNP